MPRRKVEWVVSLRLPGTILDDFGLRATTSLFERKFYTRDLAYVPERLLKALSKPLPDVVVRPVSREEVARVLRYAWENQVPVTTRGGGSTAYGNAVPAKAGIVLDMNSFQGTGEIDREGMNVWVAPGTTWFQLDRALKRQGLAICSYPSSAQTATVGGWFSMGGLGLGSLRYGALERLVESLEVVLSDGEARRLTRESSPPLGWFAGAEGTLGVITGLSLRIREKPEWEGHYLIEEEDFRTAVTLAKAVAERLKGRVFNLHINGGLYNRLLSTLGHSRHVTDKVTLAVDLDGRKDLLKDSDHTIRELAAIYGGELCDAEAALEEWDARFSALRIKRQHPALLGAEILLPLRNFGTYMNQCDRLSERQRVQIMSYGHVVAHDRILVMSLLATDERKVARYLMDMSLLKKIYEFGAQLNGLPYAIGLWNTPYLKKAYDGPSLRQRKERKDSLDPKGIMNPGKVYGTTPLLNPTFFSAVMGALYWIRRLTLVKEAA